MAVWLASLTRKTHYTSTISIWFKSFNFQMAEERSSFFKSILICFKKYFIINKTSALYASTPKKKKIVSNLLSQLQNERRYVYTHEYKCQSFFYSFHPKQTKPQKKNTSVAVSWAPVHLTEWFSLSASTESRFSKNFPSKIFFGKKFSPMNSVA